MSTPKRPLEIENQGTKKATSVENTTAAIEKPAAPEPIRYHLLYDGVGNMPEFVNGIRIVNNGNATFYLPGFSTDVPKLTRRPDGVQIVAATSRTSVVLRLADDFTLEEGPIRVTTETLITSSLVVLWKFHVKIQKRQEITLQFE